MAGRRSMPVRSSSLAILIRAAAVVGPVLDQDQALLAQGGEVLLHGALVASSKARDRGVAGGEHRRATQAPAAVEGQRVPRVRTTPARRPS